MGTQKAETSCHHISLTWLQSRSPQSQAEEAIRQDLAHGKVEATCQNGGCSPGGVGSLYALLLVQLPIPAPSHT